MQKLLFVASEAHPLVKTGGLGDVCGSLPVALRALGLDVRLLLPAYRDAKVRAGALKPIAKIPLPYAGGTVTLLEGTLPETEIVTWLVDDPPAFDRAGDPYLDKHGAPWSDNASRFARFAEAASLVARGHASLNWRPDVVHCHDWQTALVPALLSLEPQRPATIFTIHNLAYQGLFPAAMFSALKLPPPLWSLQGLEFHGQLSFIKGGLAYADWITTVSPTYAREIQSPAMGYGLEGLLRARANRLVGILNGIDTHTWDPARDRYLARPYSARTFATKVENKRALQTAFGLPVRSEAFLLGLVGRLVEQKGIDQLLDAWPALAPLPLQLVLLGTGESRYEQALTNIAARDPNRLAFQRTYDEAAAHRIEGGSDAFLMPSRFEPCGLNQMYSMRYGTPPIVRRVGGLADTVIDATSARLADGTATGFVFREGDPQTLVTTIARALALYRDPAAWQKLALTGMGEDFSWSRSAQMYLTLYRRAAQERAERAAIN